MQQTLDEMWLAIRAKQQFFKEITLRYTLLVIIQLLNLIDIFLLKGWTSDVVEPLDYEDFLAQHHSLVERDPLSSMLDFPPGDVEVNYIPRTIRTLQPVVPEEKL